MLGSRGEAGREQAIVIAERFRCHPQFAFPYELYDKSKADCLYCVICQKKNPVEADRCPKCGAPLLK